MKKIISLLLALALTVGLLVACAPANDGTNIRIAYLNGPTGIGMAKLIHDNTENGSELYTFEKYADTEKATQDLHSGKLDIVCLPTNEAAKYFNLNDSLRVLAINCLNTMSLVVRDGITINSIEDLNGKTIYTCLNGTPRLILNALLAEYGINATVKTELGNGDDATVLKTPDTLAPVIKGGKADIVFAPTHLAAAAITSLASTPDISYSTKLDINSLWESRFNNSIAMGCVVTTQDFIDEHPDAVTRFLNDYRSSINFMANSENADDAAAYIVDAEILAAVPVAKKALAELGNAIAYVDGSEMKDALISIYGVFGLTPIGGKLPDDKFYYGN